MVISIEKKLSEAGYKMLGDNGNIKKLIIDILKTENTRYLKAIPFLIYKHKADLFNFHKKNELLQSIIAITIKIFKELNIRDSFSEKFRDYFEPYDYKISKELSYQEFKDEFELQLRNENKTSLFVDKQKIYAERDLQMNLSMLFTRKEKQIIRRLMNDKPISRTDYEYYSRKTRKKLNSIIGLQEFARSIYDKTPKYDSELFLLKKKLEEWIEKATINKDISITKFFLWDENKISISYKKKTDIYSEEQIFNTLRKINEIKDKETIQLLKTYREHNFS